jgi:hypothetical protein
MTSAVAFRDFIDADECRKVAVVKDRGQRRLTAIVQGLYMIKSPSNDL